MSGILALTFLALRDRRCLTYAMVVLALIPLLDGIIVLRHAGWTFTPAHFDSLGDCGFHACDRRTASKMEIERIARKKIEKDPAQPRYVVTEPWLGYGFQISRETDVTRRKL